MRKGLISIMIIFSIMIFIQPTEAAANSNPIYVFLDGKEIEFINDPFIRNGTTLIEFRPLFEALGMRVQWDAKTRKVTGTKKGLKIEITINSRTAKVNGKNVVIPQAPSIMNGKTLVPLRFINEASGKKVHWGGDTRMIIINDGQPFKEANFKAPKLNQSNKILQDAKLGKVGDFKIDEVSNMTMAQFVSTYGFPDFRHDGTPSSGDIPFISYGDYLFYTIIYNPNTFADRIRSQMTDGVFVELPRSTTNFDVINEFGDPDYIDQGMDEAYGYDLGRYHLVFYAYDLNYNSEAYDYHIEKIY